MNEGHWDVVCDWIERLPYSEIITGERVINELSGTGEENVSE